MIKVAGLALAGLLTAVSGSLPAAAVMTIKDMAFVPPPSPLVAGQALTITNSDGFEHTATASGQFDVDLKPGQSRTVTFTHSGTFEITCRYHPTMKVRIIVQSPTHPSNPAGH